ncbi:MAG: OadG family protein [Cyclobacteriaceae bacterium]|nr:OadG family protein [Cyclobacteriaceae bacterium]
MAENYQTAFMLLAVGMITVFVILLLIVLASKLMISVINRYFPAVIVPDKRIPDLPADKPDVAMITAIITAVDILTNGRGHVEKIDKIEQKI